MIAPPARQKGGDVLTLRLFVKGALTNPLNASGWEWRRRSEWAATWQERVQVEWLMAGRPMWSGPARVTFTGYVARLFDDDNFPACVKPIRDRAVALILGTDDGPTCGHSFSYAQETRRRSDALGVLITISPLPLGTGEAET